MKLAAVAMIRNESDIIGAFLQHLDALFDHAVLMDHHSMDGTDRILQQVCAQRPGWTLWHIEAVGYHQEHFSRFATRHVMRRTDADFVFFLDADEFVGVPDRAALEASLARLTDPDRVGHLFWRNLVPDRLDARAFHLDEHVWSPAERSRYGKAVVPRAFYRRHWHEARVAVGNHGLYYSPERMVPADVVGELLHLPVRSHAQLSRKVLAGTFATMARMRREVEQGRHWIEILHRIADGTLTEADLIGIAAHYSEPDGAMVPIERAALSELGFVPAVLGLVAGRDLAGGAAPDWVDPVRLVAAVLRDYRQEDTSNSDLVLEGDLLRFVPRASPP
jgi:hypothetical protein